MKKVSILATTVLFISLSFFIINTKVLAQPYTIVIDAGHGGKDNGAEILNKVAEKDIALSLAKQLQEKTKDNSNYNLIFTRDSDEFVRLDKRIYKPINGEADLFISIHLNSNANAELSGIECYTAKESENKIKSEQFAKLLIDEFKQLNEIKTQESIKQADFAVIDYCKCPAILLNIGYLSNSNDLAYIMDTQNQKLICDKILNAIARIDK